LNKEEMKKRFYKNVEYLQRNIPPDDIYLFTEQTFMAAIFFLKKWAEHADIDQECADDPIARKWVLNIIGLYKLRATGQDVDLDLNMDSIE